MEHHLVCMEDSLIKKDYFIIIVIDDSYHWLIPVSLSCASKPEEVRAEFLIEEKTKSVKIENVASTDWIKVKQ